MRNDVSVCGAVVGFGGPSRGDTDIGGMGVGWGTMPEIMQST